MSFKQHSCQQEESSEDQKVAIEGRASLINHVKDVDSAKRKHRGGLATTSHLRPIAIFRNACASPVRQADHHAKHRIRAPAPTRRLALCSATAVAAGCDIDTEDQLVTSARNYLAKGDTTSTVIELERALDGIGAGRST